MVCWLDWLVWLIGLLVGLQHYYGSGGRRKPASAVVSIWKQVASGSNQRIPQAKVDPDASADAKRCKELSDLRDWQYVKLSCDFQQVAQLGRGERTPLVFDDALLVLAHIPKVVGRCRIAERWQVQIVPTFELHGSWPKAGASRCGGEGGGANWRSRQLAPFPFSRIRSVPETRVVA